VDAILAGLHNLPITVTPHIIGSTAPLTVTVSPASQTVTSGTDAHFVETISVPADTPGQVVHWQVQFQSDTGSDLGTEDDTITINGAPTVTANPGGTINENDTFTLTGSFTDFGLADTHQVDVDWGDPNDAAHSIVTLPATSSLAVGNTFSSSDGATLTITGLAGPTVSFSVTHQYLDDGPAPGNGTSSDTSSVLVTVTDNNGGSGNAGTTVVVNNVNPVITSVSNSSPDCGDAAEGQSVTASASFTDVGTLDVHTASIDWGDGSTTAGTVSESGGSGTASGSHAYAQGGIYTITITLADDDLGSVSKTTTAYITGAGVHGGVLQIIGTKAADQVSVNPTGNGQIKVQANFLPGPPRSFPAAGISKILMVLCDGNDLGTVSGNIVVPTIIDGDEGNDHLNGGGGPTLLLGGAGDDDLVGGPAKDGLVGGTGAERLVGSDGADLLIAGKTAFDTDYTALDAILAEWAASGTTSKLIASNPDPTKVTVFDDDSPDVLTGSSGIDMFLWNPDGGDKITDLKNGETAVVAKKKA